MSIQFDETLVRNRLLPAGLPGPAADASDHADRIGGFAALVEELVADHDLERYFEDAPAAAQALLDVGRGVAERAYGRQDSEALQQLHRALYVLYEDNLRPAGQLSAFNQFNPQLIALRNLMERAWANYERRRAAIDPDEVPTDGKAFGRYFRDLCRSHQMVGHPLFRFLANEAGRDDLIAFFLSDAAVIVRFCDLVVLSMVGVDDEIRPELAENFWDEMGQGAWQDRHVKLYRDLLEYAGVNLPGDSLAADQFSDHLTWQGYAGYNLYLFLCLHRKNQFRSLGALGAAEMMDPDQYSQVLAGCRRVGLEDEEKLAYYAGHAEMDIAHGDGWCDNVLVPLIERYPERRAEIVEGALIRMNITLDYYDDLHRRLSAGL